MRIARSFWLRLRPVHVALLVASALYLIAGTAGAHGLDTRLRAETEIEMPMAFPPPPKSLSTPSLVELMVKESKERKLISERNLESSRGRTWYVPLVYTPF